MFNCVPKTTLLRAKKKETLCYMILHNFINFINCPVFIDIKQTLHYEVPIV